jgi:hypothetical protein
MVISYHFTPSERSRVALAQAEVIAIQRHRDPDGLETGEATWAEFQQAREAFRVGL